MPILLLHSEVCEECKQLASVLVRFSGWARDEDIAICKECLLKAYAKLKKDEDERMARDMRPIHGNQ